jgi:VanZ family protein
MRIRYPFAGELQIAFLLPVIPLTVPGAFAFLLVAAAYIGLLPHSESSTLPTQLQPNDKFLHLVTFFLLSVTFYWILDTTRKRTLHVTLLVCTLGLGIGSEVIQAFLPNGRDFDLFDIVANVVGSLSAIGLCGWYHRRMMERRRQSRYGLMEDGTEDVELGGVASSSRRESETMGPQESGVMSLEQEVDNWDENAVDNWDTEEGPEHDRETAPPIYQESSSAGSQPAAVPIGAKRND